MFYSQYILAKKGALGTIWIAAHLERKLRKNQVADTDIPLSVDSILFPDVPIALRLSSHLLLGVVRIYSKKVGYLFDDCSDALLKVKQAFRSSAVDLPPEESTAPYHSITLPETFDLDDFQLPDTHFFHGDYVDHHVSARDQITLQDTMEGVVFSTSQFGLDERFGDGDTSGLDLDEGLLENPVRDGDTVGHAQAPSTPVMAEEPNIQEASICDDHHELEDEDEPNLSNTHHQDSEDCNMPKLTSTENLTRETSCSDFHSGRKNGMMSGSFSPTGINSAATSDDGQQNNTDNSIKSSISDLLVSPPTLDPLTEDPVEEARSPQVSTEYSMCESLQCSLDGGVYVGVQNNVTGNDDQQISSQLEPKTILQNDQSSLEKPHDSNSVEGLKDLEKSFHVDDPVVGSPIRNNPDNSESRATEDPNNPNISSSFDPEKVAISFKHVLQPCKRQYQQSETIPESNLPVSPHSQSGVPEICSDEALGRDEEKLPPSSPMEFQVEGNQPEFFNLNDKHENVTTIEPQLDLANEIPELPTPENFLSLPREGHMNDHLLEESTPNEKDLISENVDDGTSNFAGKKRSFTESTLTVDSINSFESLGVVQSKRTKGSVPADDDLLSSILVGKSSFLKLKPTPPPERPSKKRPRSTTRTVSSKKKVLVDDNMVLHGDQIRQQLTNTGDIRRLRKKAPCTRSEIWMIQKEYLDEEIFSEPIFTGFSSGLASIYSQECDLTDIALISLNETQSKIQEVIRNDMPVQADSDIDLINPNDTQSKIPEVIRNDTPVQADTDPDKETEKEVNHESDPVGSDTGAQSPDRQQHEDKTPSEGLPFDGKMDTTAVDIDAAILDEPESIFSVNPFSVDNKEEAPTGSTTILNGVQLEEDLMREDQTQLETQFVEMEASIVNKTSSDMEDNVTIGDDFRLEGNDVDVTVANGENVLNGDDLVERFVANYFDEGMVEFSKTEFGGVINENANLEFEINNPDPVVEEVDTEPVEASIHDVELHNHGYRNSNSQNEMDPDNFSVDYSATVDHGDFENNIDQHDTGFLNEDDDEIADEGDDCAPSGAENIGFIDNSGWSSRTRAVAKYLQVLFDKEAEQGKKALPMNNLLIGKSRKEASRMFFEALVLKTRDYIHIEQAEPFDNINMKPRVKLMKSDF